MSDTPDSVPNPNDPRKRPNRIKGGVPLPRGFNGPTSPQAAMVTALDGHIVPSYGTPAGDDDEDDD